MEDAGAGLPGWAKKLPGPEFYGHRLIFHPESLALVKFDNFYVFALDFHRSGR